MSFLKPVNNQTGFTIVETLIVLAVTGFMLATAIFYIAGKQNKTQFMTAVNDLQQEIQQVINQTASGYPGGASYNCHGNSAMGLVTIDNNGPTSNCTFVGSAIQFGTDLDPSQLVIWPLVGNQRINVAGTFRQVQSLPEAHPTAVYNTAINPIVDASSKYELENGLTVQSSGTSAGMLALVTSFSTYGASGLNSGSQQFVAYSVSTSTVNTAKSSAVAAVNTPTHLNPVDTTLCVNSGSTSQHATYTISSDSSAVTFKIAGGGC